MAAPRIVVVGGTGFYDRYLVADVLAHSDRRAVLDVTTGATAPVLTSASVVPGLQVIAVAELAAGLDRVDEISCAAAPDTDGTAARARTGKPRRAERFTPVVRGLSWRAGRVGNEAGGFLVEVRAVRAERPVRHALGMAAAAGGRMPSLLAGIAVTELLAGRLTAPGPVALDAWLPPERLGGAGRARCRPLARRRIRLAAAVTPESEPLPAAGAGAAGLEDCA